MVSEMVSSFTTQNNSNPKRNYKTRYSRNPTIRRFGIRELHDNRSSIRFKRTHYAKKQNSRNDLQRQRSLYIIITFNFVEIF